MTYNILEGGVTEGRSLEGIVHTIAQHEPHVLGLVECNGFADDGARTVYALERALGMRGFLCRTGTGFHLALFVRGFEVSEFHCITDWFHHGAIRAKVSDGTRELDVMVAHLCPFSGEARVREAQYLSTYVRDGAVILMGDMNAISRHDVERLHLDRMLPYRRARHLVPGTDTVDTRAIDVFETAGLVDLWHRAHSGELGATLPTPLLESSARAELRVDYVLASPVLAEQLHDCAVIVDETTSSASDHFPVVAELRSLSR